MNEHDASSTTQLTCNESKLLSALSNRSWYSYGTKLLCRAVKVQRPELLQIAESLGNKTGDKVNVFTFNNIEFVGLESRRLDYERDKAAGTNKVERLIKLGAYERKG